MGVHAQEEGNEKMMGIPERLKRLLTYAVMGRGVHEQHAQQHNVTRYTARLRVVDLNRRFGSNLTPLNIEEVHIMSRDMDDGEEQQGICALSVEPLGFI